MKRLFAFLLFAGIYLCFGLNVSAEEAEQKLVLSSIGGEYSLYDREELIYRGGSVNEAVNAAEGREIYFDNVRVYEEIVFQGGEYRLSGSVFFEGVAGVNIQPDAVVCIENFNVEFLGKSFFSVKGGSLGIESSVILSKADYAVKAEENAYVSVVGNSRIEGNKYSIYGDVPLYLSLPDGKKYTGEAPIKYCSYANAKGFEQIFGDSVLDYEKIMLYNGDDKLIPIYRVDFSDELGRLNSKLKIEGEPLSPPAAAPKYGYDFLGWSLNGEIVSSDMPVNGGGAFYPVYSLSKPVGFAEGLSFTYDGDERFLEVKGIYHPLLSYGKINCVWYKDGAPVYEGLKMPVSFVADSGVYSAEIEFTFGEEKSSLKISDLPVEINQRELVLEHDGSEFVIAGGSVVSGDNVVIFESEKGDEIHAETDNLNYCLKFSPVKLKTNSTETKAVITVFVVLVLLIITAFIVFKSDENDKIIQSISMRENSKREDDIFISECNSSETIEKSFLSIDKARADELISDRMAKNMIFPGGSVVTEGAEYAEVSLGVLEENFSEGDNVDINKLKERGLVLSTIFKIKIIPDGSLSKSLSVFANDFDFAAVKMICLAGGRAHKVKSKKKRY